jgi:hypothetical protein
MENKDLICNIAHQGGLCRKADPVTHACIAYSFEGQLLFLKREICALGHMWVADKPKYKIRQGQQKQRRKK